MRENVLNRVLYGDPLFAPFASLPANPPLLRVERGAASGGGFDVRVRVERVDALEWWDTFRRPERGEHLVASLDLEDGVEVATVTGSGDAAVTFGEWAVERRRGAASRLWLGLNAARGASASERRLWIEGRTTSVRVATAAPGRGVAGGEVRLAR